MFRPQQVPQYRYLGQGSKGQVHQGLGSGPVGELDGIPGHIAADHGNDDQHQEPDGQGLPGGDFHFFLFFLHHGVHRQPGYNGFGGIFLHPGRILEHIGQGHQIQHRKEHQPEDDAAAQGQAFVADGPYGCANGKRIHHAGHIACGGPYGQDPDPGDHIIAGQDEQGHHRHGVGGDFFPQAVDGTEQGGEKGEYHDQGLAGEPFQQPADPGPHGSHIVQQVEEGPGHQQGKAQLGRLYKALGRCHDDVPQSHGLESLACDHFPFDHNGVVDDLLGSVIIDHHRLGHEPGKDGGKDQEQEHDGIGAEHLSLFLGLIGHFTFLLSAVAFLPVQLLAAVVQKNYSIEKRIFRTFV